MNKTLALVFALSFATHPVMAWGEGECSLCIKYKASQDETGVQVDRSDSTDR